MSIIKLSQDVVNQISAGEVVERPAHLVKELIENSIDANSTIIHLEIASGGRFIRVSDNGVGISKDNLELALTRHATSKIIKTDDLWNLTTFGFRGEALASAAAVSYLTITSIKKDESVDQSAFQLESRFGQFSKINSANRNQGTEIKIESLFENVPARLKFLKSDAAEFSQIRSVVKAMALANPQTEFKLVNNGQLEFLFKIQSIQLERIKDVLEIKKMYQNTSHRNDYTATAFFASPHEVHRTSKNIWIFAQGRWVQDRGLQAAVTEAHRSLLMHGEYPICAVFLNCKPDQIDVNIHPTKSQVKFQDASLAFRAVQASFRDGLEQAPWIEKNQIHQINHTNVNSKFVAAQLTAQLESTNLINYTFNDQVLNQTIQNKKRFDSNQLEHLNAPSTLVKSTASTSAPAYWSSFDVIGQVNQTYIVCQKDDKMILVDQHAAHERVAFEKLMGRWKSRSHDLSAQQSSEQSSDVQIFLFPIAIDLSVEKIEALMTVQYEMQKIGIDFELMGPQVLGLKSSPSFIKDSVYPFVFEKMGQEIIDHGGSHRLDLVITDIFATMACHSVVRAGQSLSLVQMKQLLVDMDEFPMSSFCPHGRPVSIEYDFHEIEKKFGRIN